MKWSSGTFEGVGEPEEGRERGGMEGRRRRGRRGRRSMLGGGDGECVCMYVCMCGMEWDGWDLDVKVC